MRTIILDAPVTVRSLGAGSGVAAADVLTRLREKGAPATGNELTTLDPDLAKWLGLLWQCHVEVRKDQP
jgi:hypothetical protein